MLYWLFRKLKEYGWDPYFITSDFSMREINHTYGLEEIHVVDYLSIRDRLKALRGFFLWLSKEKARKTVLLFDDFLPVDFLVGSKLDTAHAKAFSRLLFWVGFTARVLGVPAICSTIENTHRGIPFRARFFVGYGFNLVRIVHVSRIRLFVGVRFDEKTRTYVFEEKPYLKAVLTTKDISFLREREGRYSNTMTTGIHYSSLCWYLQLYPDT